MCVCHSAYLLIMLNSSLFRIVKKSSYRLNFLILVIVFVGFIGTRLHIIKLDDDMSEPLASNVYFTS